jgi:hypothetical protein
MNNSNVMSKILIFGRYAIYITYPFLLLLLLFLIYITFGIFSERNEMPNMLRTMKSGNEIVRGLEACRKDTGQYPQSLNALVPKYLPKLPGPSWGNSGWVYKPSESGFSLEAGFVFGDGDSLYPSLYLISPNRWRTDS